MAESTISFLLNKLVSLVGSEARLLRGGWEEIGCLRWELEWISAFLRDAEALEESDEEVKTWLKQLREVALDAEDAIDEFVLIGVHDHGEGLYGCINKLCHGVKNVKARYRLASELRSINTRIRSIFAARNGLAKKLNKAAKHSSLTSSGSEWHDQRDDAVLLNNTDLVGVDGPKRQLIEFLVDGDADRQVAAVTGMGGIGKTAMVKKVFDDPKVKKCFKTRVWITVSQSSNAAEFLKNLIQSLTSAIRRPMPNNMTSVDNMMLLFKSLLRNRKYLIILDDVWDLERWEAIKYALPNNCNGSRVMLTTRRADVASTAACRELKGEVYVMTPLSEVDSWQLFCRKAFRGKACPSYLSEICESILGKCEGLPLAIVALSGVLATKDKRRIDEWDLIRRSLGAELHGNDKLDDLTKVLFLSFNDLPYYLKWCFLYLCVFPEGPIKRRRVIRLWIAEEFVAPREGRTLEEVAQDYLDELLNRSLIQVTMTKTNGRVKAYRVHGLLREIIILKSKDQNFAAIVKPDNVEWPERSRRLSLHNASVVPAQHNRSAYQLRSFFMFGNGENSLHFPLGFKFLRVLLVEKVPLGSFPMEIVDLYYLKHLSLRKTNLRRIPRSIGKLKNLEILDLKHTLVKDLPLDIVKLQKLRHLLVYRFEPNVHYAQFNSKLGFKAFSGIGRLRALQQLCFIEASQACSSVMSELMNLNELRRLGIMRLMKKDGPALCASIERLTNLRVLSIKSTRESEEIDLRCLSTPPRFLERLYLIGRLEELPCWLPSVRSLVKLFLKWSQLRDDPLVHLEDLPNLVHLELLQAFEGDTLRFQAGKFKKLKLLGLDKFDKLKSVDVVRGAMPGLEKLIIQRCDFLQRVPSGVEHLTELKVVEFFEMPNEMIAQLKGEDYWRVSHVPEVYSTYLRGGVWDVRSIESFREHEAKPAASRITMSHPRRTLWKV